MRCEVFKAPSSPSRALDRAPGATGECRGKRARPRLRTRTHRSRAARDVGVVRARRRQYVRVPRIHKQNVGVRCLRKLYVADTGKGRTGSKTHPGPRKPQRSIEKAHLRSTQFTGSRGNLHRRLKVMGTFTAARSKATEPNLPLNDIINTARRSPDRVFFRTLLASRREIRRMGAAALSAAPRFGVTRRRRASAPRTRNRELLVGGAPLQAAPRATRDLPPCRRRSQASRPRCRSTAGERL